MTNSNQQTIQAYEAHVQEYINGTPQKISGGFKEWLDAALTDMPKTARILELGSAAGRDAGYMQALGYIVDCTDATQAFVDLLNRQGLEARKLNAITDTMGGPYDLVLANAVLLHFTRDETRQVLRKVFASLNFGGVFAFTLKQGEGEQWSNNKLGAPRYFCFWTAEQIHQLLEEVGFSDIQITADQATANAIWLQIIVHKP